MLMSNQHNIIEFRSLIIFLIYLLSHSVCLARFFTMFTCFAVNIMTLAAIAVDRYDAICRAPVRKITSRKTVYYLIFIWLFTLVTVVPGGTGHILTGVAGHHICTRPGRDIDPVAHTGKSVMLAVVTLWIVPSLCVIFNRFYGIVKYVREYSSHLRSVLGVSGVKKEVKLTKICVAMIITYLSLWIMFAIMVILRNRSSSLPIHCAYLWAYSLAYSSFAVVPIEYMILDKRFLTVCGKRGRNPKVSNEVTSYNKDLGNVHLQPNETASTEAKFSCLNHIRTGVTTADSPSFSKGRKQLFTSKSCG